MSLHTHRFTHEIEDGPSGPARSYWDIERNGMRVITVCLPPRRTIDPVLTIADICNALDKAFEAGRTDKALQVRTVLGIK